MKLIAIVLLAANILFWGLQMFGAKEDAPSTGSATATRQFGNLQLLSEKDAKQKAMLPATKKAVPEIVSSEKVGQSTEQCLLVGPFSELLHAEYLQERLKGLEVGAEVRHIEIADGKNYWVYLKPEMSEKEALRRLYEIQAKSLSGYIISEGEFTNGISLGQFALESEANEKVAQVKAQGYQPEIKEVPKSHSEIWVEVQGKDQPKITDERWLDLLKEEKNIEKRQNYCLGVAH